MNTFDEYLGVIARSHGLDGTMILSDVVVLPRPLQSGDTVAVGYSREFTKVHRVAEYSSSSLRTTLRLEDVKTSEAVVPLIDQAVYARAADVGIDAGVRFRIGDVEGCSVVDEAGSPIGIITDIWLMPANDVWVVTTPTGATIPLPVIDDVILRVDLSSRTITVRLLPGLADIDSSTGDRDDG